MTTELMQQRGIRTVNISLDLHKKLMILKAETDYPNLSSLIGALYNYRMKKIKKLNKEKEVENE